MKDLREMTSKELKEMAKEMKISNGWNLKKEVLIAKIEERQNMSEEEKQAIADQRAEEDAAIEKYTKNWRHYTKTYNPLEFIEKWRKGEIVFEDEEPVEAQPEQPENTEHDNTQDEEENSSMNESEAQDDTPVEEQPEQQLKPRRGALIEFDGKSQNICAWGEELGISPNTLYGRIYKMNWSVERAFTTPARKAK